VCEAVAEHNGIQVSEHELKRSLTGIFGSDVDVDGVLHKNPQLHKELLKGLRIRRAVDFLLKKAKVFFDAPPTGKDKPYTPLVPPGTDRKKEDRLVFTAARGLKRPAPKK
jgi:hypothetical protein